MKVNRKVEIFITTFREISPLMERICLNGSCYRFHLLLQQIFPQAVPFYDENYHVITWIDDRYYDVLGEVDIKKYQHRFPALMLAQDRENQSKFCCELRFSAISK